MTVKTARRSGRLGTRGGARRRGATPAREVEQVREDHLHTRRPVRAVEAQAIGTAVKDSFGVGAAPARRHSIADRDAVDWSWPGPSSWRARGPRPPVQIGPADVGRRERRRLRRTTLSSSLASVHAHLAVWSCRARAPESSGPTSAAARPGWRASARPRVRHPRVTPRRLAVAGCQPGCAPHERGPHGAARRRRRRRAPAVR